MTQSHTKIRSLTARSVGDLKGVFLAIKENSQYEALIDRFGNAVVLGNNLHFYTLSEGEYEIVPEDVTPAVNQALYLPFALTDEELELIMFDNVASKLVQKIVRKIKNVE